MYGFRMTAKSDSLELLLRPYAKGEERYMLPGLQTRAVTRYTGVNAAQTPEMEQQFLERLATDPKEVGWAICVVEGGTEKPVGTTTLRIHDRSFLATSGIIIYDADYWNRGVASLAHLARTYYAAEVLDLVAIYSGAIPANQGSWKALEKSGYCQTGTQPNMYTVDGQTHDCHNLLWVNPNQYHWDFFWRERTPAPEFLEARKRAQKALERAADVISFTK